MAVNNLNLPEISQEDALSLSKFFIKSKDNFFLFGRKGTGKTFITTQAIKECGLKVNYINLSVLERSDLMGFPQLFKESEVVNFLPPSYLPPLPDNKKPDTVILFDEVDKAPPEITAPLLEILQFKRINGKPINVNSCILTGNLSNEGTYSNQISTALLDRGAKYILSFDFNQWLDWAKNYGVHDLILGFLKSNPEFSCGEIESSCYATPSPRGWTLASDAIFKAKTLKIVNIEAITQIVSGFVGYEAGLRFKMWYEHYRKFEPIVHSLIDSGHLSIDYQSLAPTEKLIFVITACHYAKIKTLECSKHKNRFLWLENLCKFIINNKVDFEIQIVGLYNAFNFEFITKHKLYECKTFFDLFSKINDSITMKKK